MDVYGLYIMTDQEWEDFLTIVGAIDYPFEFYVGTNEQIFIDGPYDVTSSIEVIDISDEEGGLLSRVGLQFFGQSRLIDSVYSKTPNDLLHLLEN